MLSGTVNGSTTYTGGLAGQITGTITNVTSSADITGNGNFTGGLAGYVNNSSITASKITGKVTSTSGTNVGGFIGQTLGTTNILTSSSTGEVTGISTSIGGFVGNINSTGIISSCFSTSKVTGTATSSHVGGFVGYLSNGATITQSYATGDVTNNTGAHAGGFVGYISSSVNNTIQKCFASGNVVNLGSYTGGFAGRIATGVSTTKVEDSYSVGNVSGVANTGGFIGSTTGSVGSTYIININRVYSIGKVTGTVATTGALVGQNLASAYVTNSNTYYVGEIATVTTSAFGTNLTLTESRKKLVYSNWDFASTWTVIEDGMERTTPYLTGLPIPEKVYLKDKTIFEFEGKGTIEEPFLIHNELELGKIREAPEFCFKILENITMASTNFTPIDNFSGRLDGNNKIITDLKINQAGVTNIGLFANITTTGVVENLRLENVVISGGAGTGAIAGISAGKISNVAVTGAVTGNSNYIGGLVGQTTGGEIDTCSSTAILNGAGYTGGFIGYSSNTTIKNSYSTGNVTSTSSYSGGFIGSSVNSTVISNSYSTGNLSGSGLHRGGFIGYIASGGNITNSYASGNVTGGTNTGGFVGYISTSSLVTITKCYASGNVVGGADAGGFIGKAQTTNTININNSYAVGTVTGTAFAGGFIGNTYVTSQVATSVIKLNNVYSSGTVTAVTPGGLVGRVETASTYITATNSYWILDTSNIQTSALGKPIFAKFASDKDTYNLWDFSTIWNIVDTGTNKTTPILKNQIIPDKAYINNLVFFEKAGAGTIEDPFQIYNEADLNNIRNGLNYNYKLMNDITLSNTNFDSIVNFTGSLDGNEKTINNLTINKPGIANIGLFADISATVTIKNLHLQNVNISGGTGTGAIAGISAGKISNVSVTGAVTGNSNYIGGLVGQTTGGEIDTCSSTAILNGAGYTGGFVGYSSNTTIKNSYSTGNVTSTSSYSGGFIGSSVNSTVISNSYSTGNLSGSGLHRGGFIGYIASGGNITNSYASGNVSGGTNTGGFIGYISTNLLTTITKCYASGNVTGGADAGGFIGKAQTTNTLDINNSYAVGTVTGTEFAGGFIGNTYVASQVATSVIKLNNVYSSGTVTAVTTGGLVGRIEVASIYITATNSYWILDTSNIQTSALGQPIFAKFASNKSTYNTWDFDNIWGIIDSGDNKTTPYIKDLVIPNKAYINNLTFHEKQGAGTVEDPFQIFTEADLNNIKNGTDYSYKLMNDITLVQNFEPIINYNATFDGNNKTIKNLTINKLGTANIGLFANTTNNSVIKNVTLENVNIIGGDNTGSLVGNHLGTIINSHTSGTVESNGSYVGGIAGYSTGSLIQSTGTRCSVKGINYVGGFIGTAVGAGNITTSFATGNVTGTGYIGGFIGDIRTNLAYEITKSYATGNVSATAAYSGGFIGRVYTNGNTITIENTFATGNVTGLTYTGGFIGYEIVSSNTATMKIVVKNSYSLGVVKGTTNTGGFVGLLQATATFSTNTNCYWNIETSQMFASSTGTGLYIENSIVQSTYNTWDFDTVWGIIDTGDDKTMPYLKELMIPNSVYLSKLEFNNFEGEGTITNPFLIKNENDLIALRNMPTLYYKLNNDITLSNDFEPIANFSGNLDGNNKTIHGLKITKTGIATVGLFANTLAGSIIKNLNIENADVTGAANTGILVGSAVSTTVTNVSTSGTVTGAGNVGGLIGYLNGTSNVSNSYSSATVTATSTNSGGFIGYVYSNVGIVDINNSYAIGDVKGAANTAGFIGSMSATSTAATYVIQINNVYAGGKVTTTGVSGGLIGLKYASTYITVTNGYWIFGTTGQTTSAAGTILTTENASIQASFVGYNFTDVWQINETGENKSFPYLKNLQIPDKVYVKNTNNFKGLGTLAEPILIETESHLDLMNTYKTMYFKLSNDITMQSTDFTAIVGFGGTLDGNNKTISNLKINKTGVSTQGLFANILLAGEIRNLSILNADIIGGGYTAVLAGRSLGKVTNVKVSGKVNANSTYSGGMIGYNEGIIKTSSADVEVKGVSNTGGFIGRAVANATNSVSDCYSTGNVTGTTYTGGFIGYEYAAGNSTAYTITVTNSYSTGSVIGTTNVGGFVGLRTAYTYLTNTNCYWNTETSGTTVGLDGTGKTTAQMTTTPYVGVYATWNFTTIWELVENAYPKLREQ